MSVSCECFVLSGRVICEGMIPRPEKFRQLFVSQCECECEFVFVSVCECVCVCVIYKPAQFGGPGPRREFATHKRT